MWGEVRGQAWEAIKAMQEQETAKKVPNRKLRYTLRKIAEMEVTWSNVIAAKIDGTAHPMAKKVSAEFSVDSAVEVFELTPEQELRLVELAGARHNPKLRTIRIVSTRYRYREQNQRDIARVLSRLIDEAKRAKPLSEGESPPGEGVGHQRQQLTSHAGLAWLLSLLLTGSAETSRCAAGMLLLCKSIAKVILPQISAPKRPISTRSAKTGASVK